jgi:ferredoxin-type protein NapF
LIDSRRRFFLRGQLGEAAAPQAGAAQRPPWALQEARFIEQCDRCRACVEACPQKVLKIGDGGFPEINFSRNGCDFCGACERACAPRALDRAAAEARLDRAAEAPLDRAAEARPDSAAAQNRPAATLARAAWPGWQAHIAPNCLALNQIECRVCADACDARAIRFRPAPGGISQMRLDPAACTACGLCVSVCPAGAITLSRRDEAIDEGAR